MCRPIAGALAKFYSPFYEYDEILHWAEIGLWDACLKYQERLQGDRFEFYAALRIRGSIIDELRDLSPFPRSMKKEKQPILLNSDDIDLASDNESLDEYLDTKMLVEKVVSYMTYLSRREREVIRLWFAEQMMAVDIAKRFRVTEARISQIKTKAIKKLALLMNLEAPGSRLQVKME